MKTKSLLSVIIIMLFIGSLNVCAQSSTNQKKALIVYYSLRNGNTRIVAEHIQKSVGGDIFRIETVNDYPSVYNEVTAQAKRELESGYRPPLKNKVKDFSQYDVIYIGSPNWWNTIAPAVMTFLESYNFEGKTIVPFITHEGSRLGASVTDIKKMAPKATVLKGLPVRGGSVNEAMPDVQRWLKDLGLIK
ncbi:flavodoxin [Dysgonomonas macrotermitis]|uniref:Flavodoxin n=1 Tax=Dysgonomonas macrotermitis TaxID=1346286 RepID=A0A1M5GPA2_9BACT|nr:flavodoxin [Dysgonomonas macrotermitis]SHG05352.1 Flavodoxin [Dysgonomonas macrotermitis]